MAAISSFQQQGGLNDTGVPDAATIAAVAARLTPTPSPAPLPPILPMPIPPILSTLPTTMLDGFSQIVQRLKDLEQMITSPNNATTQSVATTPNDPLGILERVLGMAIKVNSQPGAASTPAASGAPSANQLKQIIDMITAIVGQVDPGLGQVNGALGETIGNLLNGKKTAIGMGGSLITSLLAAVSSSPNAGGLAGLLGSIATSVPGLSQFALPIFLAMTAWGVLGKFEKWSQGIVPQAKLTA